MTPPKKKAEPFTRISRELETPKQLGDRGTPEWGKTNPASIRAEQFSGSQPRPNDMSIGTRKADNNSSPVSRAKRSGDRLEEMGMAMGARKKASQTASRARAAKKAAANPPAESTEEE